MKQVIRWQMVLYLVALFATGSISGWVLATRAAKAKAFEPPKPNEIAASFRDRVHSKLNLTPDQAMQVDAIIEKSSKEIQRVHGDCIKRIRQGLSNRNNQINALLTPDQQKLFEQVDQERQNAWRNKEGRRFRGGRGRTESSRDRGEGPDWNLLRSTNSSPENYRKGE